MTKTVTQIAEDIKAGNNGQIYYSYGEVAKIIGIGRNTVPAFLNRQGILSQKLGTKKIISAYDIAEAMYKNRTVPYGR